MRQVTADPALQILGAALFIQTPALFNRTGHVALCAHWMVLAAVWLSNDRQPRHRAARAAWVLLCAAVAATQPYLAVLLLGLALAAIASDALEDPRGPWRVRPVADVAVIVGVMASVFWLSGYFLVGSTSDLGLEGVGFYSMNLLAPVIAMGYSTLLPSIPAGTPGQYRRVPLLRCRLARPGGRRCRPVRSPGAPLSRDCGSDGWSCWSSRSWP